jgi:UDP-N-acetylglucosamine--N-acetylmuramyl-(pentapeptide) pyrophosphoryl-undecaprenol N-acetylglucosamine transferase
VVEAAKTPYPSFDDGLFRLLVAGGSQGARVMSDIVPAAVAALPDALRTKIAVVQQARPEDIQRVEAIYAGAGVRAEIAPFFADFPARVAAAHYVIARAGASTVSELAVIGRPAMLVPLPHALDQDQAANAAFLEQAGGAETVPQSGFTPEFLTRRLADLIAAPGQLSARAEAARRAGVADAADRLADLIIGVARADPAKRRQA